MAQTTAVLGLDDEAIRALLGSFLALAAAHAQVAAGVARRYRARIAKLGIEPIEAVLAKLTEQAGA